MKLNLSRRIMLFISILVAVICFGFGYLSLELSNNAIVQQTEDNLVLSARNGAELVDAINEKELKILEELAARARTQTMDWEIQRESLMPDVKRLGYIEIGIMTPDGMAKHVLEEEETFLGDRVHNQRALEGESNVSDVLISKVINKPVMLYAVPIRVEGRVAGVLFGRKDAAAYSDITDNMGIGENGYAFIVGQDGTLFAHPDREMVLNQDNMFEITEENRHLKDVGDAVQSIGVGNTGVAHYEYLGSKRYMGMAPMESTGWMLAVGAHEEDILGWKVDLQRMMLLGFGLFLALGIAAALFIGRDISRPITALSTILERLSHYDLTYDESSDVTKYLKRRDEIGTIANSLATMQKNLAELIRQFSQKAQQVASSSEELSATSHESSVSAEEVARAIEEIAKGASDQATETEKGSTNILEMGKQIDDNQEEMKLLKGEAEGVVTLKDEGLDTIKDLVAKTEASGDAARKIFDNIMHTNESAQKIEKASQMIDSIAEQTNLLALNAAIEAARAGEAGRGFSVVAEEIRKLAEESNNFTSEISKIVRDLAEETQISVETMKEVGAIVESQIESVGITQEKFDGIAQAIENMKDSMENFNKSLGDIGVRNHQVIDVIQNLSAISEENAAGTQEASASVQEQTAAVEEISGASEALAKLAEEMQMLVAKFKL